MRVGSKLRARNAIGRLRLWRSLAILPLVSASGLVLAQNDLLNPTGQYAYAEEGYEGEMTIEMGTTFPRTLQLRVKTVGEKPGTSCDFSSSGRPLVTSELEMKAPFDQKPSFNVSFQVDGASVEAVKGDPRCPNGRFDGRWTRTVGANGFKMSGVTALCLVNYELYDRCYQQASNSCESVSNGVRADAVDMVRNVLVRHGFRHGRAAIEDIAGSKIGYCGDGCSDYRAKKPRRHLFEFRAACVRAHAQ